MKHIVFISDIHSNYDALIEVLNDMESRYPDIYRIVVLGDIVDYGANPNKCLMEISKLRTKYEVISILGNHDELIYAILTNKPLPYQPKGDAWVSALLTCDMIDRDLILDYVSNSSMYWVDEFNIMYTHATPVDNYDESINRMAKYLASSGQSLDVAVQGHTHIPANSQYYIGGSILQVLNPGSVGQPRDLDNRASYGVISIDDYGKIHNFDIHRVEYDIQKVMAKMKEVEIPAKYINRLELGE